MDIIVNETANNTFTCGVPRRSTNQRVSGKEINSPLFHFPLVSEGNHKLSGGRSKLPQSGVDNTFSAPRSRWQWKIIICASTSSAVCGDHPPLSGPDFCCDKQPLGRATRARLVMPYTLLSMYRDTGLLTALIVVDVDHLP
ncbi:hypothetical protein J6590_003866 [Homalodisca vitripennis]|nr:hypothetical protein J6590_003866 [Homalodisca vitripennis]